MATIKVEISVEQCEQDGCKRTGRSVRKRPELRSLLQCAQRLIHGEVVRDDPTLCTPCANSISLHAEAMLRKRSKTKPEEVAK